MSISSNNPIRLSSRLMTAAGCVRPGSSIADVGTDHAYLPAYLILSGLSQSAAITDIADGPLARAQETVRKYNLQDRIKLYKTNGLEGVPPADDVFICGMGGELILDIILQTPWLKDSGRQIICQPMTRAYLLRRGLYSHGFEIYREIPTLCDRSSYIIICARYCGNPREVDDFAAYCGLAANDSSAAAKAYLGSVLDHARKKANGTRQQKWYDLCERIEKNTRRCGGTLFTKEGRGLNN
ncbi:MAG: class I SAM-dependent methyltransferase [Oscillospiraceae bacterium]|nr:class I SAM-dependent methyltransferase [Oscillospiraceae bacterium]